MLALRLEKILTTYVLVPSKSKFHPLLSYDINPRSHLDYSSWGLQLSYRFF